MNWKSPKDKYQNDAWFHQLVDMLVAQIEKANYTPSELREAAILASIIYHEKQSIGIIPQIQVSRHLQELEHWLKESNPPAPPEQP